MWTSRFGVCGSGNNYSAFPSNADWGYVYNYAALTSTERLVTLSKPATGCDASQVQTDYNGSAGGNVFTAIPANKKIYFEMRKTTTSGFNGGYGIHNALSATLGSQWIRSWRAGPAASGPDRGTPYVGSNSSTTLYSPTSEENMRFAVDTINSKVWVGYGPDGTWLGGGNPALGTSPSFSVNVTGWYIYAESYYTSCGSGSALHAKFYNKLSEFAYTPPSGFEYNL